MDYKDYYGVLGVAPDADQDTIKKAYRRLARQHHPDVNPDDQQAEEKFKEINEAYQALSTPEQRQKYDALREQYQRWQQTGGRPQDFQWQNWTPQPDQEANVYHGSPEDFEDIFGGGQGGFSDFFSTIFGQARPARGRVTPRPRKGRDVEYELDVTLEEAAHGGTRLLQIGDRRIEAQIPKGVKTGSRVRLSSQGEPSPGGGPAGNLYLVIHVLPHPLFERDGDNLYITVPLDIYTAVLGGEVRVPTLEKPIMLSIPPQTQADRSFRLRGKGLPRLGSPQTRGDLFVRVKLVLPDPLSEREIELFRSLAEARQTA